MKSGSLTPDESVEKSKLETRIALLHMYDGDFIEADRWIEQAIASAGAPGLPPDLGANLVALRGVAAMRRGETENCVDCLGPSSCIFPLMPEAIHTNPRGSQAAVAYFTDYLRRRPSDLGVRWLLNVAEMTLGTYPDRVPPEFLLPPASFASLDSVGRFDNVASLVGLDQRGPNMAGGSIFDDFTGDGLPDIVTTTADLEMGASFFVNRGDGTFEDRSKASGLDDQPMAPNASHADFDNDGRLDLVLLRGNWEHPYRLSLMRNLGEGRFEDVTLAAGLGRPIACPSAVWGDYDNDGDVELFACGEYSSSGDEASAAHDPKRLGAVAENFCRLYRNNGDGTFTDVAESAGVTNQRWAKGATWGDFDNDGQPDLYVSNFRGPNRLYHNNGDGTFKDLAFLLGVTEPMDSFACWAWDYDNDGKLDLFVNAYRTTLDDFAGGVFGLRERRSERPRLFRNLGAEGFKDVTTEAGLDRAFLTMGANFADVDNDGFLDMYLATGKPGYSMLVPNVMLKNVDGHQFVDITTSSGTGHLQKGHGVSFADWDRDGDLDLFVEAGGAAPGDKAHNLLFQNPGQKRHWLEIRLVGTRSNRSAIGAKVRVDVAAEPGRQARSIYREVGGNSSFGGNSLAVWIGLGDHSGPVSIKVEWPTTKLTQTFGVGADRAIEIREGADSFRTFDSRPLPGPWIPTRPSLKGRLTPAVLSMP